MKPMYEDGVVTSTINWSVANDTKLSEAITIADCKQNEGELLDDIAAETCVLLRSTQLDDSLRPPLTLNVEIAHSAHFLISELSIICEARHLEIYNRLGQYVTTVRTNLLDRVDDDFAAYESEIHLESPLDYVTIKFLSLRSRNEMWLYGLKLRTVKRNENPASTSQLGKTLDVGTTITKLEKDGVLLSDNAKRFASLLQAGSHGDGKWASAANFMAMLTATAHELPRCITNEQVGSQSSKTETNVPPNPVSNVKQGLVQEIETRMVAHLETSLHNLEHRLWSRIETRLAAFEERQEALLDKILKAMETKVKPRDEKE